MDNLILKAKSLDMDEAGKFKAVFATLGVIDHHGDIIDNGSITQGEKVRISAYNHSSWGGTLPVGKGVITEEANELVVNGEFFTGTTLGKDTYLTVKALAELGEWSFGFDILDSAYETIDEKQIQRIKRMKVYEVSPVLLGAGINTRTVDVKRLADGEATKSVRFSDHTEMVGEIVADYVKRCQDIAKLRTEEGKGAVSQKNREELAEVATELLKAGESIKGLLAKQEAEEPDADYIRRCSMLIHTTNLREVSA